MSRLLGGRSRYRKVSGVVLIGCLLGGGHVMRTRGGGTVEEPDELFSSNRDVTLLAEALKLPSFYDTVDHFAQCAPILRMIVRRDEGRITLQIGSPSQELNRGYEHTFLYDEVNRGLFELRDEDGGIFAVAPDWLEPTCDDPNCFFIMRVFFTDARFRRQRVERERWQLDRYSEDREPQIQHMTVAEVSPSNAGAALKKYRISFYRHGFDGDPQTDAITFIAFFDTKERWVTELYKESP